MNQHRWKRRALPGLALVLALSPVSLLRANESQTPLAVLNGKTITENELAAFDRGQITKMNNQIYLTRKQTLDAYLTEQLFTQEAKKRGLTREQLVAQEITEKVANPTDAEMEKWFNDNKGQVGNKPFAELKSQIATYLKNQRQQQRQQEFLQGLRKTADLKVLLKPPVIALTVEGAPSRGPATAPVTIVEFSDYQCPYCARAQPELAKVREAYKDKVKIVFKDFPLDRIHPNARKAAEAARCAGEQNKYWELHDIMFANNNSLDIANVKKFATDLKLDMAQFNTCVDGGKYAAAVTKDAAEGNDAGVSGTPAFFINGRPASGALPFATFQELIEEALAAQ